MTSTGPRTHSSLNPGIGPGRRLRYNAETGFHEECERQVKFVKGPIPLDWVTRANALPGKAGAVGIALWFLAGVQRSTRVKTTVEVERIASCERKALYAALTALEQAALITCDRRPGRRAYVQLLSSST